MQSNATIIHSFRALDARFSEVKFVTLIFNKDYLLTNSICCELCCFVAFVFQPTSIHKSVTVHWSQDGRHLIAFTQWALVYCTCLHNTKFLIRKPSLEGISLTTPLTQLHWIAVAGIHCLAIITVLVKPHRTTSVSWGCSQFWWL